MTSSPESAVESIRESLQLDGADLHFQRVDDGVAHFRLDLDGVECLECVMPGDVIEQIVITALQKSGSDVHSVTLCDPRAKQQEK